MRAWACMPALLSRMRACLRCSRGPRLPALPLTQPTRTRTGAGSAPCTPPRALTTLNTHTHTHTHNPPAHAVLDEGASTKHEPREGRGCMGWRGAGGGSVRVSGHGAMGCCSCFCCCCCLFVEEGGLWGQRAGCSCSHGARTHRVHTHASGEAPRPLQAPSATAQVHVQGALRSTCLCVWGFLLDALPRTQQSTRCHSARRRYLLCKSVAAKTHGAPASQGLPASCSCPVF